MTEETLQAAILKLNSMALTQYAIIKDLYHRPVDSQTVDKIAQHALNLANAEAGMLTLKRYAEELAKQSEDETASNQPEEPTPVEVEDDSEPIRHDELMKRSKKYRDSMKGRIDDES